MKYLAKIVNRANRDLVYYREKGPVSGSFSWTPNIEKAVRFDSAILAVDSMRSFPDENYQKQVIAETDLASTKIYAAGRSRRTGDLYYRAKAAGWYLTSFADKAYEHESRFAATESLVGMNKNFWDFKVGTMDEIQKWYDQFGKSEPVTIDDIGDQVEGFKPSTMFIDESHWLRRPLANHDFKPIGFVLHHTAEPANQPEVVKIRRSVESAVSSELSWDTEKMGVIVDFLGSDFLEDGMTVDKLYSVLYDLHEEMTEDDES